MLCPEVWNFPISRKSATYQSGEYDKKAKKTVDRIIGCCPFNKMVSVVLPDCEVIPAAIKQLVDAGDYYLIRNLKLCDLVRKDFLEAFIKRGRLTGISSEVGVFNNCEDVFAITPDGKLILSIGKDLYRILGLEGHPVGLSNRNKERFEITIDLKNSDFHEESKLYNRIKTALSKSEIDPFDFQLFWEPIDPTICPSSIAKFLDDCGYVVEQRRIEMFSTTTRDLKIPNEIFTHRKVDSDSAHAVAEYFATIMLGCDKNISQEINSYKPSVDLNLRDNNSMQAVVLHCKGLITADFIVKLIETARLSADWKLIIFCVNSYEKAPVAASNGYLLSMLNNTKYFLFNT